MSQVLNTQTIIRQLDPNVWIFSTPFFRYSVLPVGGRSTAIKLSQSPSATSKNKKSDVWILASTPLNQVTKDKIDEMGEVKYIMSADLVHTGFVGEYAAAYPDAKVIGVKGHKEKFEGQIKFDGVYGEDPPSTEYGFERDIKAVHFAGHKNGDVAFLHVPSKSLIEADLLFNLPAYEQHQLSYLSYVNNFIPYLNPQASIHASVVNAVTAEPTSMGESAKKVAAWDFDRIIPCHGDVIEKDGNKAWRDAYAAFLN